jgi:exonuclease SbcD
MLPYLEPHMARYLTGDESIRTQQQAYEALVRTIPDQPGERRVFVGHAFVAGGQSTGSERQLSVGGSEIVSADVFAPFTYVALGHLHRPQHVGHGKVRYPGSLLAYSFDEVGQAKSVELVDIGKDGSCDVRRRPLVPLRAMRRAKGLIVKGAFVLDAGEPVPGVSDFVEVSLRNQEPVTDAMAIVQAIYPNTLRLRWERLSMSSASGATTLEEMRRTTPLDLLKGFFLMVQGKELSDMQIALGQKAVQEVERELVS